MKRLFFLLIVIASLLTSCSNDARVGLEPENEIPTIEIHVVYTINYNDRIPDVGSKVYLYYDINVAADLTRYSYEGDGVFIKGENIVHPDSMSVIDEKGDAILFLKHTDKEFTILTESCYHYPRKIFSYHPYYREKIVELQIFHP